MTDNGLEVAERLRRQARQIVGAFSEDTESCALSAQHIRAISQRRRTVRRTVSAAACVAIAAAVIAPGWFTPAVPETSPSIPDVAERTPVEELPPAPVEVYATWQTYEPLFVVDPTGQRIECSGWLRRDHRQRVDWEQLPQSQQHAVMNVMHGSNDEVEFVEL